MEGDGEREGESHEKGLLFTHRIFRISEADDQLPCAMELCWDVSPPSLGRVFRTSGARSRERKRESLVNLCMHDRASRQAQAGGQRGVGNERGAVARAVQ